MIGKQICAFSFGWPENLEVVPVGRQTIEALHAAGELGERQRVSHDELKAAWAKARRVDTDRRMRALQQYRADCGRDVLRVY